MAGSEEACGIDEELVNGDGELRSMMLRERKYASSDWLELHPLE